MHLSGVYFQLKNSNHHKFFTIPKRSRRLESPGTGHVFQLPDLTFNLMGLITAALPACISWRACRGDNPLVDPGSPPPKKRQRSIKNLLKNKVLGQQTTKIPTKTGLVHRDSFFFFKKGVLHYNRLHLFGEEIFRQWTKQPAFSSFFAVLNWSPQSTWHVEKFSAMVQINILYPNCLLVQGI